MVTLFNIYKCQDSISILQSFLKWQLYWKTYTPNSPQFDFYMQPSLVSHMTCDVKIYVFHGWSVWGILTLPVTEIWDLNVVITMPVVIISYIYGLVLERRNSSSSNMHVMTQQILTGPARVEWLWVNDFSPNEYHIWHMWSSTCWHMENKLPTYNTPIFAAQTHNHWR